MSAITIIITVHNAAKDLRLCLESVFAHTALSDDCKLLVIDDGSTEEEINSIYEATSSPHVQIMKNTRNIGYTRTINRAARHAGDDDIILLNSDTIVTPNWLEKLRKHAESSPLIGTVTPVSNNAGAFSVPRPGKNALPPGVDIDQMARIVEDCGRGKSFDAPTGNGFCLYIRRALLDIIGYFDEINFPLGYGEENDFCMRAGHAGFRNLVALDTYIWHSAHASFGDSRKALMQQGLETMCVLYPDYHKLTGVFSTNPLFMALRECVARECPKNDGSAKSANLRATLRGVAEMLQKGCFFSAAAFRYLLRHGARHTLSKAKQQLGAISQARSMGQAIGILKSIKSSLKRIDDFERRKIPFTPDNLDDTDTRNRILEFISRSRSLECIIDHNRGGGANAYSAKRINDILATGKGVLHLVHAPASPFIYAIFYMDKQKIILRLADLSGIMRQSWIPVDKIIINELVSWFQKDNGKSTVQAAINIIGQIVDYVAARNIPLEYLVHDYYCVCPEYTLMNNKGIFCDLPDGTACKACLERIFGKKTTIGEWRGVFGNLLNHAANIICFSEASRKIIEKAFPAVSQKIEVRPHSPLMRVDQQYKLSPDGPLTVAVIGNLSTHKGLKIVKALAKLLAPGEKLVIIGECECFAPANPQIIFHGAYQRDALPDILAQYGVTIGLVPSVWPETFCYVAQECMQLGLPLVTFDLGAQGERTRAYANGLVASEMTAESALAALRELDSRRSGACAPMMEASNAQ